ncbi:cupin domain-containing protein [Methyloraptor flagellatus]|uniref:Cupin domain-containing protein n=1 Tax=Methyloraptor flagellatus TaxID=3162530 RepID=A0AAU7XBU5_9HYPH
MQDLSAAQIVDMLGLARHPEGGYFRETYRDPDGVDGRSHSTAIYFLLPAGEVSAWHRVDAVETWHWYAGAPLALTVSENGHDAWSVRLGGNLLGGERPQAIVPKNAWQTAESLGAWTLVGCTVAPAFRFEGFELAPPDWRPRPRAGRSD